MEKNKALNLLKPFTTQCEKDNDPYLVVHFSRKDDYYSGFRQLDKLDAIVVIREIVQHCGIDREVLALMLNEEHSKLN